MAHKREVVQEFFDALAEDGYGWAVLGNLAYDLHYDRHNGDTTQVVAGVVSRAIELWQTREPERNWAAEALWKIVIDTSNATSVLSCCGCDATVTAPDGVPLSYSRVIDEVGLNYLLRLVPGGPDDDLLRDQIQEQVRFLYEQTGGRVRSDDLRTASDGRPPEVRGVRPFAFAAPRFETDPIQSEADERLRAANMNRYLGLGHLPGVFLVRIEYPEGALDGVSARTPTTFDGGPKRCYLCLNDEGGGRNRALHLPACNLGSMEIVHPPIPFDDSFRWRIVGVLRDDSTPELDAWQAAYSVPWTTDLTDRMVAAILNLP